MNRNVACRGGGGCGLDQEARDDVCLGTPRQGDGGIVHVRDAHATRRADILMRTSDKKIKIKENVVLNDTINLAAMALL